MESRNNKYVVKTECEITLNEKKVNIQTSNPSLTPEVIIQALKSNKVTAWFEQLDLSKLHLANVEVRDVFIFASQTVGFVSLLCKICEKKYEAELQKDPNAKVPYLPGYIFVRGDVVAVLPIIIEKETRTKYVLLTEQYRIPVGRKMLEIPAGLMDEGNSFRGVAAKELEEEAGIALNREDLKELITIGPSVGGCDEKVKIFYTEVEKTSEEMMDIDSKVCGKIQEGEIIFLKLVELDLKQILKKGELLDAKLIAALLAYENRAMLGK